jgi:hypothetical protein
MKRQFKVSIKLLELAPFSLKTIDDVKIIFGSYGPDSNKFKLL